MLPPLISVKVCPTVPKLENQMCVLLELLTGRFTSLGDFQSDFLLMWRCVSWLT
jgi:hypothetical protein